MTLEELILNTKQWFIDRGLENESPRKQLLKLVEETGELASGVVKNNPDIIKDSIGDILVVLTGYLVQTSYLTPTIFKVIEDATLGNIPEYHLNGNLHTTRLKTAKVS